MPAASTPPLAAGSIATLTPPFKLPLLRHFRPISGPSIPTALCHAPFRPLTSPLLRATSRTRALDNAAAQKTAVNAAFVEENDELEDGRDAGTKEFKLRQRPCELYVCNLPRSVDIADLLDIFQAHGTVVSVEISRDTKTGLSRGCGYVTMSSLQEAKTAIAAVDKSDVGGREMRVRFSVDMDSENRSKEVLIGPPKKYLVFESPYKIYVGNLAWSVKPEDLRQFFSQFGTVASTRLFYDRKGAKNRVYGFVSFFSEDELKAALEANESVYEGRILVVRKFVSKEEL